MKETIESKIAYELRQNILDLLYLLHDEDRENVYNDQENYFVLLRLLFDSQFTKRIIELREELTIPKDWCRSQRDDVPDWDIWVDSHSESPKEPTDKLILKLCSEFEVDPTSFGLFMVDYLYFSSVEFSLYGYGVPQKEEFRHRTKLLVLTEPTSPIVNRDNQQLFAYIQIFKDTTRTGIEKFYSINEKEIIKIQQQLSAYPVPRVRSKEVFKRDLEIFLLDALDYTGGQISEIICGKTGKENPKYIKDFIKVNQSYLAELPILTTRKNVLKIVGEREKDEYYSLNDSSIRTIVTNFKKDLGIN